MMNYAINAVERSDIIKFDESISSTESNFKLTITCIILSLASIGIGSHLFGFDIFTDVSTLFIYLTLLFQIATRTLRFPKILGIVYAYIIVQTFLINISSISFFSSLKHFIGLIIFSLSIFSFVSVYRNRLIQIIQIYYKFALAIACIGILQPLIFVLLGISFIPQNLISGLLIVGGSNSFSPEIMDILPRSVGLSSEPAHYAIILLPGVFVSLLVLVGKARHLGIHNRPIAWMILTGFVLSFSIVGYFGLILCFISIFSKNLKGNRLTKVSVVMIFIGVFYFMSQTNLMSKINSLPSMFTNISGYQYASSDLTGFALASNILVAREGLKKSNYLGTGLNSHEDTYDEVIYSIFSNSQVILELNKKDAGSFFIRITSEFGIPGILALIIFLIHYRLGKLFKSSPNKTINAICLVVILGYCIRNGNYFSVNFMLFSALYYYTFSLQKEESNYLDSINS